jgi:hypothetical protein
VENDKGSENLPDRRRATRFAALRSAFGEDPYAQLAEFGAEASSSMADVHRAGLQAQCAGRLDSKKARAWAVLRSAEKRLLVDFLSLDCGVAGDTATRCAIEAERGGTTSSQVTSEAWSKVASLWQVADVSDRESFECPPNLDEEL